MANKAAYILQTGTNGYLIPSLAFNKHATDFVTPGIVGSYFNTAGVAPATGAFAANAQGSPNMTVAVSAGSAYVNATPTSGTAQNIAVTSDASENVTIAANATGSTRYDFIYIKVDADKLNNPSATGLDAVTFVTQRSTTQTVDSNGALANGLLIAEVTVSNGAVSIANSNIQDRRLPINSNVDGWQQANETWTYASATTITVPTGAAFKYSVGDKVRLIQSGSTKYFYIITVADTLLTVTGGSDYTVANASIGSPCYSKRVSPVGFPRAFNITWTTANMTLGTGGVATGRFSINLGRCFYTGIITLGTGGAMGSVPSIQLPTPAYELSNLRPIGDFTMEDVGVDYYQGIMFQQTNTSTATFQVYQGTNSTDINVHGKNISSTNPFTAGSTDRITFNGHYEIA